MKNSKVFLGGACGSTIWRKLVISDLEKSGTPYFNPQAEKWTEECRAIEDKEKEECTNMLIGFVPYTNSTYSFTELGMTIEQVRHGEKDFLTIYTFGEFDEHLMKVFKKIQKDCEKLIPGKYSLKYFKNETSWQQL